MKLKVFDLDLLDSHYYIKRSTIVDKIQFDNRTFYAKYERIDEPFTPLLLQQHLDKQYTFALPLLKEHHTKYLYIEYKGDESKRFRHLIAHLFKSLGITDYFLYQGKTDEVIQVFIEVENFSLEQAHKALENISTHLQRKMTKKWLCLPSLLLPNAYNIVTLPYKKI